MDWKGEKKVWGDGPKPNLSKSPQVPRDATVRSSTSMLYWRRNPCHANGESPADVLQRDYITLLLHSDLVSSNSR